MLNVTSMIDVILVLTIFFMVATKFRDDERKLDLKVPVVSNKRRCRPRPSRKWSTSIKTATFRSARRLSRSTNLTRKLSAAHSQYKKLSVLIRGDKLATHGHMTEVYNACQRAGITELAISVKLDTATR